MIQQPETRSPELGSSSKPVTNYGMTPLPLHPLQYGLTIEKEAVTIKI